MGPLYPLFLLWSSRAAAANLISGLKPAIGVPSVTHIQFADDTIIFCDANEHQVKNVKIIMLCFEAVPDLKVNFFKSELIAVGASDEQVLALADILGCKVGEFLASYLGLPLCVRKVPNPMWNPVVERVEKR